MDVLAVASEVIPQLFKNDLGALRRRILIIDIVHCQNLFEFVAIRLEYELAEVLKPAVIP